MMRRWRRSGRSKPAQKTNPFLDERIFALHRAQMSHTRKKRPIGGKAMILPFLVGQKSPSKPTAPIEDDEVIWPEPDSWAPWTSADEDGNGEKENGGKALAVSKSPGLDTEKSPMALSDRRQSLGSETSTAVNTKIDNFVASVSKIAPTARASVEEIEELDQIVGMVTSTFGQDATQRNFPRRREKRKSWKEVSPTTNTFLSESQTDEPLSPSSPEVSNFMLGLLGVDLQGTQSTAEESILSNTTDSDGFPSLRVLSDEKDETELKGSTTDLRSSNTIDFDGFPSLRGTKSLGLSRGATELRPCKSTDFDGLPSTKAHKINKHVAGHLLESKKRIPQKLDASTESGAGVMSDQLSKPTHTGARTGRLGIVERVDVFEHNLTKCSLSVSSGDGDMHHYRINSPHGTEISLADSDGHHLQTSGDCREDCRDTTGDGIQLVDFDAKFDDDAPSDNSRVHVQEKFADTRIDVLPERQRRTLQPEDPPPKMRQDSRPDVALIRATFDTQFSVRSQSAADSRWTQEKSTHNPMAQLNVGRNRGAQDPPGDAIDSRNADCRALQSWPDVPGENNETKPESRAALEQAATSRAHEAGGHKLLVSGSPSNVTRQFQNIQHRISGAGRPSVSRDNEVAQSTSSGVCKKESPEVYRVRSDLVDQVPATRAIEPVPAGIVPCFLPGVAYQVSPDQACDSFTGPVEELLLSQESHFLPERASSASKLDGETTRASSKSERSSVLQKCHIEPPNTIKTSPTALTNRSLGAHGQTGKRNSDTDFSHTLHLHRSGARPQATVKEGSSDTTKNQRIPSHSGERVAASGQNTISRAEHVTATATTSQTSRIDRQLLRSRERLGKSTQKRQTKPATKVTLPLEKVVPLGRESRLPTKDAATHNTENQKSSTRRHEWRIQPKERNEPLEVLKTATFSSSRGGQMVFEGSESSDDRIGPTSRSTEERRRSSSKRVRIIEHISRLSFSPTSSAGTTQEPQPSLSSRQEIQETESQQDSFAIRGDFGGDMRDQAPRQLPENTFGSCEASFVQYSFSQASDDGINDLLKEEIYAEMSHEEKAIFRPGSEGSPSNPKETATSTCTTQEVPPASNTYQKVESKQRDPTLNLLPHGSSEKARRELVPSRLSIVMEGSQESSSLKQSSSQPSYDHVKDLSKEVVYAEINYAVDRILRPGSEGRHPDPEHHSGEDCLLTTHTQRVALPEPSDCFSAESLFDDLREDRNTNPWTKSLLSASSDSDETHTISLTTTLDEDEDSKHTNRRKVHNSWTRDGANVLFQQHMSNQLEKPVRARTVGRAGLDPMPAKLVDPFKLDPPITSKTNARETDKPASWNQSNSAHEIRSTEDPWQRREDEDSEAAEAIIIAEDSPGIDDGVYGGELVASAVNGNNEQELVLTGVKDNQTKEFVQSVAEHLEPEEFGQTGIDDRAHAISSEPDDSPIPQQKRPLQIGVEKIADSGKSVQTRIDSIFLCLSPPPPPPCFVTTKKSLAPQERSSPPKRPPSTSSSSGGASAMRDYWQSVYAVKRLGSFDSVSVVNESAGVISMSRSKNLLSASQSSESTGSSSRDLTASTSILSSQPTTSELAPQFPPANGPANYTIGVLRSDETHTELTEDTDPYQDDRGERGCSLICGDFNLSITGLGWCG